ncbi:sporulation protein YqfD [Sporosarcina ureilytica]|uniref:Sporulation protein YqfD n=1 Tax=Sporosarcina ureilytica TaxID=298596 RepID=A0A1D8JGR0_9BACL|nr:sporulation protein YqfD [Sporosarcina ureilytica]AOV07888.1 hypothetical protein BI350_10310 [Sporosarcina ureilytica]
MARNRYEIKVSGPRNISTFLTKLKTTGTKVTSLTMIENAAYFITDKKGLKQARKYRRRYGLKLNVYSTVEDRGLEMLFSSYRFVILLAIPFVCSFFLWSVTVESEMPEVSERIEKKLEKASIIPFRLLMSIPDEREIRRDLMQDEPTLSWVHFKRSGTTLTVIPLLSPQSDSQPERKEEPADLVARTGGVITRFALTKGERVGRVYMTVKKGDTLAKGTLEQGENTVIVGADGAVFADYWVEYSFRIPKKIQYKVQGDERLEFFFHPPWKGKDLFNKSSWNIIETERIIEEKDAQLEIEEGMEETVIIPLLKMKLLAELGPDAMVKEEKILHVTIDDDKVIGTILFLINDNIAIKRPIPQGD